MGIVFTVLGVNGRDRSEHGEKRQQENQFCSFHGSSFVSDIFLYISRIKKQYLFEPAGSRKTV
jgi:hypothetical protein